MINNETEIAIKKIARKKAKQIFAEIERIPGIANKELALILTAEQIAASCIYSYVLATEHTISNVIVNFTTNIKKHLDISKSEEKLE